MTQTDQLIDFLKSFELVFELDQFLDNSQQTLLDKIIPDTYKSIIISYAQGLEKHQGIWKHWVTPDYNLFLALLLQEEALIDFTSYRQKLASLNSSDFIDLLEKQFDLKGLKDNTQLLEKLSLPPQYKWSLFLLVSDFESYKKVILVSLDDQYAIYQEHRKQILDHYGADIIQQEKQMSQSGDLYDLIFEQVLSLEEYDKCQERYLLLLTPHQLFIHWREDRQLIAMGCHVYNYYRAMEKQESLDKKKQQNILKALADPTRYGIMLCYLKGLTSNKEIAKRFSVSPSAVTYQTKFLLENQLISIDSDTKTYKINGDLIQTALNNVLLELGILEQAE